MIINFLFFHLIESYILSNQVNESIDPINQDQSSTTIQSLITKPNSYLYNPDDDNDEFLLDRVKRDTTPFVCKGEQLSSC